MFWLKTVRFMSSLNLCCVYELVHLLLPHKWKNIQMQSNKWKQITSILFLSLYIYLILLFSDRYVLVGSHHDSDQGGGTSAIMNQLIAALTEQTKQGWVPDRTTVFCSWGGSALGNIGSYEWGKVNKQRMSLLLILSLRIMDCSIM